jgi:hypothetical protein
LYDVPTILDIKTGQVDKVKHLKQQTAYAHCEPDVQQIGLIPLNQDTKQGYSKPILESISIGAELKIKMYLIWFFGLLVCYPANSYTQATI